MSRQVTCTKRNTERITHIGGSWGTVSEAVAIPEIKANPNAYHVRVGNDDVRVIVASREGREYLKTERDGTRADNLLNLKECN